MHLPAWAGGEDDEPAWDRGKSLYFEVAPIRKKLNICRNTQKKSNLDGWSSGRGIREGSLSSCDDFALFFLQKIKEEFICETLTPVSCQWRVWKGLSRFWQSSCLCQPENSKQSPLESTSPWKRGLTGWTKRQNDPLLLPLPMCLHSTIPAILRQISFHFYIEKLNVR